jgi:leucyl aminopeptidase
MQIRIVGNAPAGVRTGALVVPVFSGEPLAGVAKDIDAALGGAIADALSTEEIKGKFGEHVLVHAKDLPFHRVMVIGLGDAGAFEPAMLGRYAGIAVRYLGRRNVGDITLALPQASAGREEAFASFLAEGAIAGSFETTVYQEKPERRVAVATVSIAANGFDADAIERGVARGTVLGEAVNFARRLAITPANDMTPTHLAREAVDAGTKAGLDVEVWDADRARAEGMGSFLSVAQGSDQPPKFIIMRYNGDPGNDELLALVGKGITFDSGGISIKPADRMEEMKYDMSGGAAVIATMSVLGQLKPKINVVGLVPATENMPGGRATKPGDIVKAMNGKTIEVINTDAEGRLILADALCYAQKLGATKIVDAATLTGACVVALGHAAAALITNNDAFAQEFLGVSKPTGERFWLMPYYEDYTNQIKSDIADVKNSSGRAAGTLTAGAFLRTFVDKTPWIHVDIAGTAYLENESGWQAKGPTGTPVRSFVSLVETLAGSPVIGTSDGARANGQTKTAVSP